MTENVIVSIRGTQYDSTEGETIETIQPGIYRFMADKHIIMYEEVLEESQESNAFTTKCIIKIAKDYVSITKKGQTGTQMHFKPGQPCSTYYDTPYGTMQLDINTSNLDIREKPDSIAVILDYSLDLNSNHIADSHIEIVISPRDSHHPI